MHKRGRSMPPAAKLGLLIGSVAGIILLLPQLAEPADTAQIALPSSASGPRIWYSATRYPELPLPDGQRRVIRSVLNVTSPMRFGNYVWNEQHIPPGRVWVRIDLASQTLSVFRGGHEIGSAVILYGTDGKPTPTGTFTVLEKDEDHHSSLYDAPMPFMLRLTADGVAIHGSDVREGFATHGCIGIPTAFARLLYAQMHSGDLVAVLPTKHR